MKSLGFVLLSFCTYGTFSQGDVLLVGDSMTEFMGKTLESFCTDVNVYNAGIAGTTAKQWASYTADDIVSCTDEDQMLTEDVISWKSVYISIGGNDLLESKCSIGASELKERMQKAVTNIVNNVAPGATTYVITGYCMPSAPEECESTSDFAILSQALQNFSVQMPSGSSLQIIDSLSACGGSSTTFSNQKYFEDAIHLNAKGYCKVFTQPNVQTAMSCSSPIDAVDCDSFGTSIYGLDENCLDDSSSSLAILSLVTGVVILVNFLAIAKF
jgi:lysophospholipase L1-like esterase